MTQVKEGSKPPETKLIFERHLRLIMQVGPMIAGGYGIAAYEFRSWVLAACVLPIVAVLAASFLARHFYRTNRVQIAALVLGYTIQIALFATGFIIPEFTGIIPIVLMIAVMFVIPHVSGAELHPFLASIVLTNVGLGIIRFVVPPRLTLAPDKVLLLRLAFGMATTMVALIVLYQFSNAMKENLERALATKNALSRSERAQREERVKLATTLDNIAQAVVKLSADLRVAYINPVAREMLGVTEDVIGEEVGRVLTLVTPDANVSIESIERIARHQYSTLPLPEGAEIHSSDGTVYPVEGTYTPLLPSGAVLSFRDVGERMRLDALRNEKEAAEAAAAARTQFLANMSHEIRTPMNAVIGMTGLLLDTKLDKEQHEFVDTIRTSGSHLLSIINDILDFSRLDGGVIEFEHYAFDVRTCIEESLELVAPMAAEKGIELCLVAQPQIFSSIMGDAGRLRQVLVNFVGNAIKFTEKGEVIVRFEQEPLDGGQLRLHFSIADTGIGISPEQLPRLFKPFGQADASTTRKFGGTGLGLVISKQIIERMGGTLSVESTLGKGSTFSFSIVAFVVPDRVTEHHAAPALRGKYVLIVDDSATSRRILRAELESRGMVVDEAAGGRAALGKLQEREFDAIVIDYHMPEMDGGMLAKEIRKSPQYAAVPLVLLSSLGMAKESGPPELFDVRLTKPVRIAQLEANLVLLLSEERIGAAPASKISDPGETATNPLRILLAEDNPVNQRVAMLILRKLGYRADVVGNGLEVVAAVERQQYDVVLMDVQMPEMDGIEATKAIRRKIPTDKRPRIIAMTAHAMAGDRERCMEAGMDDYLNKPIEIGALGSALGRSERKSTQSSGNRSAVQVVRFNPARLDSLAELAKLTGEDIVAEIVTAFANDSEKSLRIMSQALEARDAKTLERAAHSFKSTCANLGGEHMAQLCQILENQSRAGELTNAADLITILGVESKTLHVELQKYLQNAT